MPTVVIERPVVETLPRYSVVRGLERGPGGCSLTVENPAGEQARVQIDCQPDHAAVDDLRAAGLRPLAVRLHLANPDDYGCSALFASAEGPQRRVLSLGAALALCADGLHTVVTRRS